MDKGMVTLVIAVIIALAVGVAVGWFAKPTPAPAAKGIPPGKFATPPKPGEEVVIIHGFDAAYPPFTEVTPEGKAVGFDVDVVDWIAKKYGWKVIHKPRDWSTIVTALEKGDIDIIASGMTINPERASRKIWFTIPYYYYIHEVIVRADEKRSLEEILNSGEYIACQLGATSEKWADKLLAKGYKFKKLALDSYPLALKAVLDGRAVACITDSAFYDPYIKKHPEIAAKFKVLSTLGGMEAYGIATRPGDFWLREKINEALEELMSSPLWNELLKKWNLG